MDHLPYFFSAKNNLLKIQLKLSSSLKASSSSKISLWEAFFSSLVVGFAETYFQAFSIHMGCSTLQSGLLASFPLFVAIVYKFYDVLISKKQHLVSSWMLKSLLIQTGALASLALLSFSDRMNSGVIFWVLFSIYSVYWIGHFRMQPAWNRWIAEIIEVKDSQKFFSKRTRMVQVGTIIGLFFGGFALNLNTFNIQAHYLFFILFTGSTVFKLTSYYLYKQIPCPKFTVNTSKEKMLTFLKNTVIFFKAMDYLIYHFIYRLPLWRGIC